MTDLVLPGQVPTPVVSIQALDQNLKPQGPLEFATFGGTLYHLNVGSWALTMKYDKDIWDFAKSGNMVIDVNWDGKFNFGGKCENPGFQDSIPGAESASVFTVGEMMVFTGADYLALIANRLAFPDPTADWAAQTSSGSDAVSATPCETAIKHYVSANTGIGAATDRQIDFLTVATDVAQGGNVSYNAKFKPGVDLGLMDIIRNLCASGGPMGVQVMRDGDGLVFDVYVPRDLSSSAWFSKFLGNLTSVGLSLQDPTLTNACVLGSTAFVEKTGTGSAGAWTRVEGLIDQAQETATAALNQAGVQAIQEGIASPVLSTSAQDIPLLQFGRDYYLGDKVTVEVEEADTYTDIISQVDFTIDPAQSVPIQIIPTVGIPADSGNPTTSQINRLSRRVRKLERELTRRTGL